MTARGAPTTALQRLRDFLSMLAENSRPRSASEQDQLRALFLSLVRSKPTN